MTENERRQVASDEIIKNLLPVYYSGKYVSTAQFVRDYGLCPSTFFRYLKRNNLDSLRSSTRKYNLNTHYFESIDSEDKAYWLGFLQCDSYIDRSHIEIGLCIKDEQHLEKLKECLNYNGKIVRRIINKKYDSCRLTITSKELVSPLVNMGLDKFRSQTMRLLLKYDSPWFSHYIRGIIDANGSISITSKFNGYCGIYVDITSGSQDFIYEFSKQLELYYNLSNSTTITKDKRNLTYRCYFRKALYTKVFEDIYKNATISLKRKQEKINAVLYGSAKNI